MLKGFREKLKWLDPFTYVDTFIIPKVDSLSEGVRWFFFVASFLLLALSVTLLLGFAPVLLALLAGFYAYLYFFDRGDAVHWSIYILSAFVFAFVLYHVVLTFVLGTSFPLMIVFSGSMEPLLYRGDVVILTSASQLQVREASVDFPVGGKSLSEFAEIGYTINPRGLRQASLKIRGQEHAFDSSGPIVVYYSPLQGKDIIHRAVLKINAPDGEFLLTFGDNNPVADQFCPASPGPRDCITEFLVPAEQARGKYLFHVPFVGNLKLLVFDDLPGLFG